MKITNYKKKDGSPSSTKVRLGDLSIKYDSSFNIKGFDMKTGNIKTFTDSSFNPSKYGIKLNHKTQYYNTKWKPLK